MARKKTSAQRSEQRKRAKKRMLTMTDLDTNQDFSVASGATYVFNKLGTSDWYKTELNVLYDEYRTIQQKKEKKMCYDCDMVENQTAEERKASYLVGRLQDARYKKLKELERKYNLVDDERPTTFNEFLERLNSGKFILSNDLKADAPINTHYVSSHIRWRDPEAKADRAGYDKAVKLVEDAVQKTQDTITISDPKDGLKALQAFEATEFK